MTYLSILFVGFVALYTAAAAVVDLRLRRIPNYLTVPAALLGLAYHTLAPQGGGLLTALAGFTVGFGLLLLPWLFGGGGMGDIKLLAALGTWLGPQNMLIAFAASIAVAALLAVAVIGWTAVTRGFHDAHRRHLGGGGRSQQRFDGATPTGRRVLPFAVAVALSTWAVLAWGVFQGTL